MNEHLYGMRTDLGGIVASIHELMKIFKDSVPPTVLLKGDPMGYKDDFKDLGHYDHTSMEDIENENAKDDSRQ